MDKEARELCKEIRELFECSHGKQTLDTGDALELLIRARKFIEATFDIHQFTENQTEMFTDETTD